MAEFHFVEDYVRWVDTLIARHPYREAMELAVGGDWNAVGSIEAAILRYAGLRDGMRLVDLGCGSGRLAQALPRTADVNYLGLDVVPALLDYARSICPRHYRFERNLSLTFPEPTASADMICAFSVFTHLLPEETYLYLEDALRILRPGGKVVLSFLEFANPEHWPAFENVVNAQRTSSRPHLNTFLERGAIKVFAQRLGFKAPIFIGGDEAPWRSQPPLWQAVAILGKPPLRA